MHLDQVFEKCMDVATSMLPFIDGCDIQLVHENIMDETGVLPDSYSPMGYTEEIGDNKYRVIISRDLKPSMFPEIILHELVHVSQFSTGRLSYDEISDTVSWDGEVFPHKSTSYHELPWEQHAHSTETDLLVEYHKK